jgi:hypothetical protein
MIVELIALLAFISFLIWFYKEDAIGAQICPKKGMKKMRGHYPIIGSLKTAIQITDTYTLTNQFK